MVEIIGSIPNTLPAISDNEFDAIIRLLDNPDWSSRQGLTPHSGYSHINKYCVTCGGKGEFLGIKAVKWEGEIVTAHYLCPCLDQWTLECLFVSANINHKLRTLGVSDAKGLPNDSVDVLAEWLDDTSRSKGQIIVGQPQSGKTLMASLIMRSYLREGKTTYLTRTDQMRSEAIHGFKDEDAKERYERKVRNVDLLVVDELEKVEQEQNREFLVRNFANILSYRAHQGRPTLLISQKDSDWLMEKYYDAAGVIIEMEVHKIGRGSFKATVEERDKIETQIGVKRPRTLG